MKKIILLVFAITFIQNLHAQVQKGAILTGGNISFNGGNSSGQVVYKTMLQNGEYENLLRNYESQHNYLAIRPEFGVFTSDLLMLGGGLTYEYSAHKRSNSYEGFINDFSEKRHMIFINPYLTKYSKLADKLYFTSTLNVMAGIGKEKSEGYENLEYNILELRVNVTPGLTYFISEKWAVRANVGHLFYNRRQEKLTTEFGLPTAPKNVNDAYGLNINFNTFGIGVQYFLRN